MKNLMIFASTLLALGCGSSAPSRETTRAAPQQALAPAETAPPSRASVVVDSEATGALELPLPSGMLFGPVQSLEAFCGRWIGAHPNHEESTEPRGCDLSRSGFVGEPEMQPLSPPFLDAKIVFIQNEDTGDGSTCRLAFHLAAGWYVAEQDYFSCSGITEGVSIEARSVFLGTRDIILGGREELILHYEMFERSSGSVPTSSREMLICAVGVESERPACQTYTVGGTRGRRRWDLDLSFHADGVPQVQFHGRMTDEIQDAITRVSERPFVAPR